MFIVISYTTIASQTTKHDKMFEQTIFKLPSGNQPSTFHKIIRNTVNTYTVIHTQHPANNANLYATD